MTGEEAMKIINAYGNALAARKAPYGDVSDLPYPKERIKEALIHWIKVGDDPKIRELLKGSYITLADWQAGFGARRAATDLTDIDMKDPTKAAAQVLAKGEDFLKLPEEVAAEAELLMADLKALEITSGVVPDASVALLAKKMAAEHMAVQFLRAEPTMAPGLAAKLRAQMASDVPELYSRVQELSGQKK